MSPPHNNPQQFLTDYKLEQLAIQLEKHNQDSERHREESRSDFRDLRNEITIKFDHLFEKHDEHKKMVDNSIKHIEKELALTKVKSGFWGSIAAVFVAGLAILAEVFYRK